MLTVHGLHPPEEGSSDGSLGKCGGGGGGGGGTQALVPALVACLAREGRFLQRDAALRTGLLLVGVHSSRKDSLVQIRSKHKRYIAVVMVGKDT